MACSSTTKAAQHMRGWPPMPAPTEMHCGPRYAITWNPMPTVLDEFSQLPAMRSSQRNVVDRLAPLWGAAVDGALRTTFPAPGSDALQVRVCFGVFASNCSPKRKAHINLAIAIIAIIRRKKQPLFRLCLSLPAEVMHKGCRSCGL